MNKYIFIKVEDAKDLEYVFKKGFVYRDKNNKLQRKSVQEIKNYYNKLAGKFSNNQIYFMIKRADEDCDRYIALHKDDVIVKNDKPKKTVENLSKKAYIAKLINAGYSEEDAYDKADAEFGEDDD